MDLVRTRDPAGQGEGPSGGRNALDIAARGGGSVADLPYARPGMSAPAAVLCGSATRNARQARAGVRRQGRRRGSSRHHTGTRAEVIVARKPRTSGAVERDPGAETTTRQPWRARQLIACAPRPGDRTPCPESQPPKIRPGSAYEQAVNGYTAENVRSRGVRTCRRRSPTSRPSIDHRPDGGLRAGGLAGLQGATGGRGIVSPGVRW